MSILQSPLLFQSPILAILSTALLSASTASAQGRIDPVADLHDPAAEHLDQYELLELLQSGRYEEAFVLAFVHGDELFEVRFNALDGVGANVGNGERFTRVPRADLARRGQWADHFPARTTGPNAESCTACHVQPLEDGAGPAAANVHRDPLHRGQPSAFIQRNTPHLFSPGAVQCVAEEMTAALHRIRSQAAAEAAESGRPVRRALIAKGVRFGSITARPGGGFETRSVEGVDGDLVVRPFQWKGSVAFLRDFNRGAAHNELGLQGVELVGAVDGDSDRVREELTVGDLTALSVYLAAQPRPTSLLELSRLGLLDPPLTPEKRRQIQRGAMALGEIGCTDCHVPMLRLDDPVFREPSEYEYHRDERFPAGQDPLTLGVDPALPVHFDLTADQPDNRLMAADGSVVRLGSLRVDSNGRAVVELFGDLKRHDMGSELAESIDEVGTGPAVFLTENLWGVGSTAPYLHDGRATTLTEAILAHGGEARATRATFLDLPLDRQQDLLAFLENLVLFKVEEEDALIAKERIEVVDASLVTEPE